MYQRTKQVQHHMRELSKKEIVDEGTVRIWWYLWIKSLGGITIDY